MFLRVFSCLRWCPLLLEGPGPQGSCLSGGWCRIPAGFFLQMDVSENRGNPKWMVYMENPIKMDDLGVPPFKETPKCLDICEI